MDLQKQQDFLARLFTDENLRQNFISNPQQIGIENGLAETDIAQLENVLPDQLNFFADSLFWKRSREAEKFLLETKKDLGENFTNLFREFSQDFNPQTVKKHLEDAFYFCDFLQTNHDLPERTKSIAKFEQAKLKFFGYGKKFVICRFLQNNGKKKSFAIWFRLIGKNYHFVR